MDSTVFTLRLNCSVACGIFLEQTSNPALADGFLSTEPPGKSLFYSFAVKVLCDRIKAELAI